MHELKKVNMSGTVNIVALLATQAGGFGEGTVPGSPRAAGAGGGEVPEGAGMQVLCLAVLCRAVPWGSARSWCFGVSIGPGAPSLPRSAHGRARFARHEGSAAPAPPLRTPCFARVVEIIYGLSLTLIVSILYILAI